MNTQETIDVLNRLLESELMALEYYRIHGEAIAEEDIADGVRSIFPAEYNHAVTLTGRIRDLGGVPAVAGGDASLRGRQMGEQSRPQGTLQMLRMELEQEQQAIKDYAQPLADITDDIVTLEILEEQLLDEMRHAMWLKKKILELESNR